MPKHFFPSHVVEAVAKRLAKQRFIQEPFDELSDHDKKSLVNDTSGLLQALWDASRVDSIEQLESVPDFASLVDGEGFTYRTYELRNPKVFPVNIIYWGDTDE